MDSILFLVILTSTVAVFADDTNKTQEVKKGAVPCRIDEECKNNSDCCSNICERETCRNETCRIKFQNCTDESQCCSRICEEELCRDENCVPLGDPCTGKECCAGICKDDVCNPKDWICPHTSEGKIDKLIQDIVATVEREIIVSGKRLVQGGIKSDSKDAMFLIRDTAFNVLLKSYGKLKELWKADAVTKDILNQIISRVNRTKVLDLINGSSKSIGNRSSKTYEADAQTSMFVRKLKKTATDLVKFMLTLNQKEAGKRRE